MQKLMNKIKKYYKILLPSFSILMSAMGLSLSFLGFKFDTDNKKIIFFVLCISEFFLVAATIYTIIALLKGQIDKTLLSEKDIEIEKNKCAVKTIFENNKAIITTYKDFNDKLKTIKKDYISSEKRLKEHYINSLGIGEFSEISNYIKEEKEKEHNRLKDTLISHYNRFLSSVTNLLKQNIEEYLFSKGCNESVSIAIKQLSKPTIYTDINSSDVDVFTAFRDSKTYSSKKRNETWGRCFKITKNSDFIMSIEKDYYIFNYMDKRYLEDGLYQNENIAFYENYNSGVTCTIYSCVDGKRKLYGYLACDSLLNNKEILDKNVYDWNIANMMMFSAHIIALYLENFLKIWDDIYINYEEDLDIWKNNIGTISTTENVNLNEMNADTDSEARIIERKERYNFCKTMRDSVIETRYNR